MIGKNDTTATPKPPTRPPEPRSRAGRPRRRLGPVALGLGLATKPVDEACNSVLQAMDDGRLSGLEGCRYLSALDIKVGLVDAQKFLAEWEEAKKLKASGLVPFTLPVGSNSHGLQATESAVLRPGMPVLDSTLDGNDAR